MDIDMAYSLFDFDLLADEYDTWYNTTVGRIHDCRQKHIVEEFLPRAKLGERLLDVGCGTGHWSRFFASLGYAVTGVDISERMLKIAKANDRPTCTFELADACNLPYATHSFEVVTAITTLEFVSDASEALREMFRCVKTSGRVLIGALNRIAPTNQKRLKKGEEPYISGRLLAPEELRQLLEPFGCVRMKTTRERSDAGVFWSLKGIAEYRDVELKNLQGTFIIAEVQT